MSFVASNYQQAIFDWIELGSGDAAVNAVAGSGKTTTIVEGFKRIRGSSKAVFAFSKDVATLLSSKMPKDVACMTINSLGHRALLNHLGKVTLDDSKYANLIADSLSSGIFRFASLISWASTNARTCRKRSWS